MQPHREPTTPQVLEEFAPEIHHVLRHILQVDLETSQLALVLEQAGIYNGEDLCMFSEKEIKNFNVNRNLLKPIYIRNFKIIMQWYYSEGLDKDDWLRLSTSVIAHYAKMYPSNLPNMQSQAAQGPNGIYFLSQVYIHPN